MSINSLICINMSANSH